MLEIRNLTIAFPTADKPLLMVKNFSLRIEEQAKTILLGESGSGKSLVLLAILRLLPAEAQCTGEILFRGRDIGRMDAKALQSLRGRQIAYIPQGAGNSLNPLTRIGLQVTEGLPLAAGESRERKAIDILAPFGFKEAAEVARAYPHTLSGGMKQRVLIAMGLARNASLTLADEPTKGLDPSRIHTVIEAFQKRQKQAVLCVTHDLAFAGSYADQIVVMYAGHQLEISAKDEFFREPRHPYSQALLAALPENGLHDLTGFAPPHTSEGGGQCIFFDRCPRRFSLCEKEPPMIQQDDREVRCWLYAADHAGDYRTLSERGASVRP